VNSSYSCYTIDLARTTGTRACVLNNLVNLPLAAGRSDRLRSKRPFLSRTKEEHRADRTALGTPPVVLSDPANFFNSSVVLVRCTQRRSPRTSHRSSPPRRYGACNPVLANPLANSVREPGFPIENPSRAYKYHECRARTCVCMCVCVCRASVGSNMYAPNHTKLYACVYVCTSAVCVGVSTHACMGMCAFVCVGWGHVCGWSLIVDVIRRTEADQPTGVSDIFSLSVSLSLFLSLFPPCHPSHLFL